MSGCYGFRLNGRDKITVYEGPHNEMGNRVLAFVRDNDVTDIVNAAKKLRLVNIAKDPSEEQIEECVFLGASLNIKWAGLLKFAAKDLGSYLKGLSYMVNNMDLMLDSKYCDVAYVINLDEEVIELYSSNKNGRGGRYANSPKSVGVGLKLVKEIKFSEVKG